MVCSASKEVRESSLMRQLLKMALDIGNFLNASTAQGSAIGFQLDTLLKLREVRSSKQRTVTLLHFIARYAPKILN